MSFQVRVEPSGHQFTCDESETILAAALRAGIGLPYGCKSGSCASCKGRVLEGQVKHGPHQERALPEDERQRGYALYCCAMPQSDLSIEAREVEGLTDYPIKKLPTRVSRIERMSDDVIVLHLQLPAVETFRYRAGQYIEFLLKDGKRRSYSMANAPLGQAVLSLHIRHLPGGLFTDHVFGQMKEREILRFEGPLGSFFLRGMATVNLFGDHPSFKRNIKAMRYAFHTVITLPEVHDGNVVALAANAPLLLDHARLYEEAAAITAATKLPAKSWVNGIKAWEEQR